MCVAGGRGQIPAEWFLEGMALKDEAQVHQVLGVLTSQRGSRETALPLWPLFGSNILWRFVAIKIGCFDYYYYYFSLQSSFFPSWANTILKVFICFGRFLPFYTHEVNISAT